MNSQTDFPIVLVFSISVVCGFEVRQVPNWFFLVRDLMILKKMGLRSIFGLGQLKFP